MPRIALFLRAVNAGKPLRMADLKRALAEAGYRGVQTLLASGNAVIEAPAADRALEGRVRDILETALGCSTGVFARDAAALDAVIAANPFPDMARDDPSHLVVVLLDGDPDPAAVEALRARIAGPEQVAAGPACLYAAYPVDIGNSRLTGGVIERTLKQRGTGRNWNTIARMAALTRDG